MKQNIENEFLEDSEYVLNIIAILKDAFQKEIFCKYNNRKRDFATFYLKGRCPSFARILYEIFDNHASFYEDFSNTETSNEGHAIVKIGDHFYDASGIVDDYRKSSLSFRFCSEEEFAFYEEFHCLRGEHEEEIEKELILLGKQELHSMILNHTTLKRALIDKSNQN